MKITNDLARIFDVLNEGILIIDTNAEIVYGNKSYCNFIKMEAADIIGKKLLDFRPGAQLPNVLKTGRPILNVPRQEAGDPYFVNMYPVVQEGQIIGGISVVTQIQQAQSFSRLLREVERSKQVIKQISKTNNSRYTFDDIIAADPLSLKTKKLAKKAARTEATILLESESGTGKELYAQAIHNGGARAGEVFLAINCANFNIGMLEAELFGYEEGAFTGAKKGGKIGLFKAATNGTLFLDEISEMDISLQSKLLRVLQEARVRPVGGVKEREIDVRIIAACNANLLQYMQDRRFRSDLYWRLNIFPITIPPLRERKDDIDALVQVFLSELSKKQHRAISIEKAALQKLRSYDWPGNVRELRNVIEFVSYTSDDGLITESMLPRAISQKYNDETEMLTQRVKRFEKGEINRLLRKNGSDLAGKRKTASELGISLASLYNKLGKADEF